MKLTIEKTDNLKGSLGFSGDKSISHRALILSSLAKGKSEIHNLSKAQDCESTLSCLTKLGIEIERKENLFVVHGKGLYGLSEPDDVMDVGNSGTTMRLLPGILAGQEFLSVLTGDMSVRRRPMDRIINPLTEMGADISGRQKNKYAPLAIRGTKLNAATHNLPVASAQVKSCLLLAGLFAQGETTVIEPAKSRDHTERIFDYLGIDIKSNGEKITVRHSEPEVANYEIPGDFSTAFFYMVAAVITKNSGIELKEILNNPTRNLAYRKLVEMGAQIFEKNESVWINEPVADFSARSSELNSIQISGKQIPGLIDEIPALAVAATRANGTTVIKDAAELRVKESDRITALCTELKKMGADIEETPDGMIINGPTVLRGAECDSHGDHRIAMALAVAGLVAEGKTTIENAQCIGISHPDFEQDLKKLSGK
jgi:3-phosphoshikimate 1-carboxyvinyltransferase